MHAAVRAAPWEFQTPHDRRQHPSGQAGIASGAGACRSCRCSSCAMLRWKRRAGGHSAVRGMRCGCRANHGRRTDRRVPMRCIYDHGYGPLSCHWPEGPLFCQPHAVGHRWVMRAWVRTASLVPQPAAGCKRIPINCLKQEATAFAATGRAHLHIVEGPLAEQLDISGRHAGQWRVHWLPGPGRTAHAAKRLRAAPACKAALD